MRILSYRFLFVPRRHFLSDIAFSLLLRCLLLSFFLLGQMLFGEICDMSFIFFPVSWELLTSESRWFVPTYGAQLIDQSNKKHWLSQAFLDKKRTRIANCVFISDLHHH